MPLNFKAVGGSNIDTVDAQRRADEKLNIVERKINGEKLPEGYEADIQEEIVRQLDEHHIVTRNRYGAEVLNSDRLVFVDIDQPHTHRSVHS